MSEEKKPILVPSASSPYDAWTTPRARGGALACLVGAILLTALVILSKGHIPLDMSINDSFVSCTQGAMMYMGGDSFITAFMKTMTFVGSTSFLALGSLLIVGTFIFKKTYTSALFFALTMLSGTAFNHTLKILISRPRPNITCLHGFLTGSFPSGHTLVSTLFIGTLAFLLTRSSQSRLSHFFIVEGSIILVAFVGLSRMYLGYHWFSDVIGGWLFGLFWTIMSLNLLTYWEKRSQAQHA